LLYDAANEEMERICKEIDYESTQSVRFHVNSWGLSACQWFAETILPKMEKLIHLDLSETKGFQNRSDVCMSTKALLEPLVNNQIYFLNVSNNFFDEDGARAFSDFLEKNKSLEILIAKKCGMNSQSCEMLAEVAKSNSQIPIKVLDFS
jgi:Ran GTPase-activating protein (RanGAP) involved in mRNA processing and transport